MSERPGTTVDGWQLLAPLGQGAMGVVWRARHVTTGRVAALKLLRDAGGARAGRLAREAALAARLDHPGVVRVLGASAPAAATPWIAFELLEAATPLGAVLPGLDRAGRLAILRDVARAVGHAHARGVVHRDLKPDNVLVDAAGVARVADFGLALADDVERLTQTGTFLGTPMYMAPEVVEGRRDQVGPPTDVWALGVMLFEALLDRPPFDAAASFVELAQAIAREAPPGPRSLDPGVPPAVDDLVRRCLARDPRARPRDAEAVAAALDAALEAGAARGAGGARPPRAAGGARRRRRPATLAAGLLLGLALAGGLGLAARRPGPAPAPPDAAPAPPGAAPAPGDAPPRTEPDAAPVLIAPGPGGLEGMVMPPQLDALAAGPDGTVYAAAMVATRGDGPLKVTVRALVVLRTADQGRTWARLAEVALPPGEGLLGATLLASPGGRRLRLVASWVDQARGLELSVRAATLDLGTGALGAFAPVFEATTLTPHAALDRAGRLVVLALRGDGAAVVRRELDGGAWGPTTVMAQGAAPVSERGAVPFGVAVDALDRVRVLYAARREGGRGLYARALAGERPGPEVVVTSDLSPSDPGGGAALDDAGGHHVAFSDDAGALHVASVDADGRVARAAAGLDAKGCYALTLGADGPALLVTSARGPQRVTFGVAGGSPPEPLDLPGRSGPGGLSVLRRPPPGLALALLRAVRDDEGRAVVLGHVVPAAPGGAAAAPGAPGPPPGVVAGTIGPWPGVRAAGPVDADFPGLVALDGGRTLLALARVETASLRCQLEVWRSDDGGATWRALAGPPGPALTLNGALLPAPDGRSVVLVAWGLDASPGGKLESASRVTWSRLDVATDRWLGPPEPVGDGEALVANAALDARGEPVVALGRQGRGLVVVRHGPNGWTPPVTVAEARGVPAGLEVGPDDDVHVLVAAGEGGTTRLVLRRVTGREASAEVEVARGARAAAPLLVDAAGGRHVGWATDQGLFFGVLPAAGPAQGYGVRVALGPRLKLALALEPDGPALYCADGRRLLRAAVPPGAAEAVVAALSVGLDPGEAGWQLTALRRPAPGLRAGLLLAPVRWPAGAAPHLLARLER